MIKSRVIHTKLKLYKPSTKTTITTYDLQLNEDNSAFEDVSTFNDYTEEDKHVIKETYKSLDDKFYCLLSQLENNFKSTETLNNSYSFDCYKYNNFKDLLSKENQLILKLKEISSLTRTDKYYKEFCNEIYHIKSLLISIYKNNQPKILIDIEKKVDRISIRIKEEVSIKELSFYFTKDYSLMRFTYTNDLLIIKDISNTTYLKSDDFNNLLYKTLCFIKSVIFNSLIKPIKIN